MVRFFYIALLVFFGSMLKPMNTYACKESKEKVAQSFSYDHNKSISETAQCGECGLEVHDGDCAGKCCNSACHCPTIFSGFTLPDVVGYFSTKIIVNSSPFLYKESYFSWGYYAIWLPPKIA